MIKTLRLAGFGLVALALGAVIAGAWITLRHGREPGEANRLDAAQVEKIVAGYLHQHPDAVFAALQAYQKQQQAEQVDAAKATIKAAAAEPAATPNTAVVTPSARYSST